jgi:PKD repeat protein
MSVVLCIMGMSLPLVVSPTMAKGLTAAAIAIILFAANFTVTNAQQQQLTSQPAATLNGTSALFQSTKDSFRVQVPQGWVVHDMNNTGFTLLSEVLQGYGILAQLCPEEQQQQAALPNVGGSGDIFSSSSSSCEGAQEEVIHILRYPNLGARLGFTSDEIIANSNNIMNAILSYQIQKLQEVGYTDIKIVNSTDTTVSVDISTAGISNNNNNSTVPAATVPAKLVEMTYRTNFAPNEIRTGQFILTTTNATPRNLGEITGYSIFYEGAAASAATGEEETTTASVSLPSSPTTTAAIRQVFDSFELIVGEEIAQDILAALATQAEEAEQQEVPTNPLAGELISNATEGVAPATFEFEADVTGGMEPYTINWDFGDGDEESDEESVVHTFDEAGTYTVTATVIDSAGQVGSASMGITVEEPSSPASETEEVIPEDTTPPVITVPDDITEEATGPDNSVDLLDLLDSGSGPDNSGSP